MSERIKPALTPEEWGDVGQGGMGPGPTLVGELRYLDEGDRHLVAAVALHGQPFGFTWGDVDLLRSTARLLRAQGDRLFVDPENPDLGEFHPLEHVAARIAALLPPGEQGPEEETG